MPTDGLHGRDSREVVQDPLARNRGAAVQPNSIPLQGVSSPRGADFSRLGEGQRVIAKLLGNTAGLVDQYVDKKRSEWELEGKMAYAQGVAEEELAKTGNKYQMTGFLSMKVNTAATEFLQNEYSYIEDAGKQMTPEQYREQRLMPQFKQIQESLGGSPYVSRLLGATAAEQFPRLMAQQTKSHNSYVEDETVNSWYALLRSKSALADPQSETGATAPEDLRKYFSQQFSGIKNIERHKDTLFRAMADDMKEGNFRLAEAFMAVDKDESGITVNELPSVNDLANYATSIVMSNELHSDGVIRVHKDGKGQAIGGINSQAYPEQFAEASDILRTQGQTAAMQYIRDFYKKEIIEKNGVEKLPASVQDVVTDGLTNHWSGFQKKLLDAAKNGATREELIVMRRQEYFRLAEADPAQYEKNLSGWLSRLNSLSARAVNDKAPSSEILDATNEQRLLLNLSVNGASPAQINNVLDSYRTAHVKKSQEFDKDRIMTEESLVDIATREGNLPAMLDRIQQAKEVGGYSDKWAESMSNRVATAVRSTAKERKKIQDVTSALNNGELALRDPSEQKLGIDILRSSIIGRVQEMEGTKEEKEQAIRSQMTDALSRNNVVDPLWERTINLGLTGEIVTPDGNVNSSALKAYEDIKYLRKNTPSGYAERYMSPGTAKLVAQAEAFDATMNADQALVAAYNIQKQNKESAKSPIPTSRKEDLSQIEELVSEKISEELDTGFIASFSRHSATNLFDISDEDIAFAKSNPMLKAYMNMLVRNEAAKPANINSTTKALANEAWTKIARKNIELAPGGNILIAPEDGKGSIRSRIGAPNAGATNFVHKLLQQYKAENGKKLFGPRYNSGVSYNTKEQVDAYKAKAVEDAKRSGRPIPEFGPNSNAGILTTIFGGRQRDFFKATSEGIYWELLTQTEDGSWIGDGDFKIIPYDELGRFRKSKLFE